MKLLELIRAMETIAPTRYAEAWDNVGLLVGDPNREIARALLTIDYTRGVADEAKQAQCDVVIAYHPPLFSAVKHLIAPSLIFDAAANGIAIYSPHTALDVAEGGTNDLLADALGLGDRAPLRPVETKSTRCKLVTFVPRAHLDAVSAALFDTGAGRIGDYTRCSFRSEGTGTFFGEAGANPVVGQAGRLETADEVRLETVVPIARIDEIVQALKASHPYEEPAFDLLQLTAAPEAIGIGRVGNLASPVDRRELFQRIKSALALDHLLIAGPADGPVSRAAVCAGAGSDLLDDALRHNADLYLTGEMRHHDALRAAAAGMTVVCTLHSNSERPSLDRLARRLEAELPSLETHLSRADRDPFTIT